MKELLQTHRAELSRKRVATFTVCITLAMPNAECYRPAVREWIAAVHTLVQPVSEGPFAGRLDFSKLPWTLDTLFFRLTVALGVLPKGGHRAERCSDLGRQPVSIITAIAVVHMDAPHIDEFQSAIDQIVV